MDIITKDNYKETVDFLNRASDAYYKESEPIITDAEFDVLIENLEAFEVENPSLILKSSPTQSVGSDITFGFEKVKHDIPMLSISKLNKFEDLEKWIRDVNSKTGNNNAFSLETKIDGSSLSLTYKDGKLVRGVSRGRGSVGDLIGDNVFSIQDIPHDLGNDFDMEIRGEVIITDSDFNAINNELISRGEKTYANSRNLASGSMKLKDSKEVKNRKLTFRAYSIVKGGEDTQRKDIFLLMKMGFTVPDNTIFSSFEDIKNWISEVGVSRDKIPYQIDGVVIKLNDKLLHLSLGGTSKTPHYLKAFKFANETAIAKIENVTFQVGRTGVITPVCHFNETPLAGVLIKKCTLHNFDIISKLGICIGDEVILERKNDVIPGIKALHKEGENRIPIVFPETCPECLTGKIEQINGEVAYRCTNSDCSGQILGKFKHFASRDCFDLFGLAEQTLIQLIELELVSDFADLYNLTEETLMEKVPRMGKKKAENITNAIQSSKNRGLIKLLVGLSIPGASSGTCSDLGNYFKSMDEIREATIEQLTAIPDIGPTTGKNIHEWFRDENNWNLVQRLKERGIKMTTEKKKKVGNSLTGKSICVTGKLSQERDFFKDLIEKNGGTFATSVSKNTSYLLAGDKAGSKMDKAEKLGVPVIDEIEFMGMIEN